MTPGENEAHEERGLATRLARAERDVKDLLARACDAEDALIGLWHDAPPRARAAWESDVRRVAARAGRLEDLE